MELAQLTVESSAPFGLFRRGKTFKLSDRLLVYPKWRAMGHVGLLESLMGDADGQGRTRTGTEISGSRRYVYGDPRRHVHWRNSARTGRMMVKEFDARNERPYVFAVLGDGEDGRGRDSEAFEDAVRIAASAARPLIARGSPVFLAKRDGLSHMYVSWQSLMADLARVTPDDFTGSHTHLRSLMPGARALAFVVSDEAPAAQVICGLARAGHPCAAVIHGEGPAMAVIGGELRAAGVPVVECPVGDFARAVKGLEAPAQKERHAMPPKSAVAARKPVQDEVEALAA
jgi:uncharacterized protein (DUF58 family)